MLINVIFIKYLNLKFTKMNEHMSFATRCRKKYMISMLQISLTVRYAGIKFKESWNVLCTGKKKYYLYLLKPSIYDQKTRHLL